MLMVFLAIVKQPLNEKEISEFKPVLLRFIIDLVLILCVDVFPVMITFLNIYGDKTNHRESGFNLFLENYCHIVEGVW